MITEKTLSKYKKYIGKTIGTLKVKERCLGIDRLDNSKNYTTENCVPCCGCCNRMKMDLTLPFFIEQIKRIYNNHKESSTTISKESTSKVIVDGSGEHLYVR